MTLNDLREIGRKVIEQVHTNAPQFLFQVDLSDLDYRQVLGRAGRRPLSDRELTAAVAWAAVQLANKDELDRDDHQGFRERFGAYAGEKFELELWRDQFGAPIRDFLDNTFPGVRLPPRGDPYSYVGAIYRHAGIPAHLADRYVEFMHKLLHKELSFDGDRYEKAVKCIQSVILKQFLASTAGQDFTKQIAREVARVYDGGSASAGCPQRIVEAVVASLRGADQEEPTSLHFPHPDPYLAFDPDSQSPLVILLDLTGVRKGLYCATNGKWIDQQRVPAKSQGPWEYRLRDSREVCEVAPWWTPHLGGWALFRVSDGALIKKRREIDPGEYYFVGTQPDFDALAAVVADKDRDAYDFLYLESLDPPVWDYVFSRVTLVPNLEIPALGIRVRTRVRDEPVLAWINPKPSLWGTAVFLDEIPRIKVENWRPDLERRYQLCRESERSSQATITMDRQEINPQPSCPDAGALVLRERSTKLVISRLSFGVIPGTCKVYPPEPTPAIEEADLAVELPYGTRLCSNSLNVHSIHRGRYKVRPSLRSVEGHLEFSGCKVPFNIAIPRVGLDVVRGADRTDIVWREWIDSDNRYEFRIETPPGRAAALLLESNGPVHKVLDDLRPRRGVARHARSIASCRDALLSCKRETGQFVLRVEGDSSPDIPCAVHYASAGAIVKSLMSLPEGDGVFMLPNVGTTLLQYRRLVENPPSQTPVVPADLPETLRDYLSDLAELTRVLDYREPAAGQPHRASHSPIRAWVEWLRILDSLGKNQPLPEPPNAVPLPVPRWEAEAKARKQRRSEEANLPQLIAEFRASFLSAGASCSLRGRAGGFTLWNTVRNYQRYRDTPNRRASVPIIAEFEMTRCDRQNDAIVRAVANVFLQLMYLHEERFPQMSELDHDGEWLPALAPAQCTLQALRSRALGQFFDGRWPDGIGLAELSPVDADADLERTAGRPAKAFSVGGQS